MTAMDCDGDGDGYLSRRLSARFVRVRPRLSTSRLCYGDSIRGAGSERSCARTAGESPMTRVSRERRVGYVRILTTLTVLTGLRGGGLWARG